MLLIDNREAKYQFIKLVKSGRSLREAKMLMRAIAAASTNEYISQDDIADLLGIDAGISRLIETRGSALKRLKRQNAKSFFTPKKYLSREEAIARFTMSYKFGLPMNWSRTGNLIRKGRPNKSRPGSSKGKISKTQVIGAKQVLSDFQLLIMSLANLKAANIDSKKLGDQLNKAITKKVSIDS